MSEPTNPIHMRNQPTYLLSTTPATQPDTANKNLCHKRLTSRIPPLAKRSNTWDLYPTAMNRSSLRSILRASTHEHNTNRLPSVTHKTHDNKTHYISRGGSQAPTYSTTAASQILTDKVIQTQNTYRHTITSSPKSRALEDKQNPLRMSRW
jgi:hypothetical protein